MKTIYLNLDRARREGFLIDRNSYLESHSVIKSTVKRNGEEVSTIKSDKYIQPYKMLNGTRILFNIEGSYIYLDELPNLCNNRRDGEIANKFVTAIKNRTEETHNPILFKWSR